MPTPNTCLAGHTLPAMEFLQTLDGIYWYQQAAQQNHCHSQYELGWHYENGKGVKKDKAQAIKYYKLAAQNGSAKAKERLEKIN